MFTTRTLLVAFSLTTLAACRPPPANEPSSTPAPTGEASGPQTLGHGGGDGMSHGFPREEDDGSQPIVRADRIAAEGGLGDDPVRRVVQRNRMQLVQCYEQALAQDDDTAGGVTITFVVDATGSVASSEVTTPNATSAAVGTCFAEAVRGWSFPAPEPAGTARVEAAFVLVPPTP